MALGESTRLTAGTQKSVFKIGVIAPGRPISSSKVRQVKELAAQSFPNVAIRFHSQCTARWGRFAGEDSIRCNAFVDYANDPKLDAIWFARGGHGACRLLEGALPRLEPEAGKKVYLGYSDVGNILAALYKRGFRRLAHGPMPGDVTSKDTQAVRRALEFLANRNRNTLEGSLNRKTKSVAFNLSILCHLLGSPYQPNLKNHVLMLEEVVQPPIYVPVIC